MVIAARPVFALHGVGTSTFSKGRWLANFDFFASFTLERGDGRIIAHHTHGPDISVPLVGLGEKHPSETIEFGLHTLYTGVLVSPIFKSRKTDDELQVLQKLILTLKVF